MARYTQRKRSVVPSRKRRAKPVAKGYAEVGLDYLKKLGKAIVVAGAGGLGAAAAYKYRKDIAAGARGAVAKAKGAIRGVGSNVMRGYDAVEEGVDLILKEFSSMLMLPKPVGVGIKQIALVRTSVILLMRSRGIKNNILMREDLVTVK